MSSLSRMPSYHRFNAKSRINLFFACFSCNLSFKSVFYPRNAPPKWQTYCNSQATLEGKEANDEGLLRQTPLLGRGV